MRIHTCTFCSRPVYPGHGNTYVRNDAKIFRYCSSKCDKNSRHKKNPRKTRWTKSYRKINGKELTIDPTFEFERRRNKPVKYNREKWAKAIDIMKTVTEVKEKRETKFGMERLRKSRAMTLREAKETVRRDVHVVRVAAAGLKYKPKVTTTEDGEQSKEEKKKNLESALRAPEINQDDEDMPNLLEKGTKQTEGDEDSQITESTSKTKEGKARIMESMDVDFDEDSDEDSEEEPEFGASDFEDGSEEELVI